MRCSIRLIVCVLLLGVGAAAAGKKHCGNFATCEDVAPAWSPDGTRIAFVSNRAGWLGSWQLFVMDADGANVRQVTHRLKAVGDAFSWSPDGKKLAISVCTKWNNIGGGGNTCENTWWRWWNSASRGNVPGEKDQFWSEWEMHIVDAGGSNLLRLTRDRGSLKEPAWSPDGKRIAFASAQLGLYHIYTMNLDGSDRQQLIDGEHPNWSPDGKKILFTKWTGAAIPPPYERPPLFQIFSINIDGSDLRQLTESSMENTEAVWSPDSNRIAFVAKVANKPQVFQMDANGTNLTQLTHYEYEAFNPAWSPDGKRIAYAASAGRDGSTCIFVMNADGSNVQQITGR